TLGDVLNNETSYPYSLDDFATFLDQTYCLENLEFWLAVKKYRFYASNFFNSTTSLLMSDVGDVPEIPEDYYFDDASLRGDTPAHLDFLKQKLSDLITTYILPNSPREINIPSITRDDLLTNVFQYNNYHPSILDPVRNQVFELMQASSFNQFL
ncbi:RGS domain-containing protein, partial [Glomus cerebriforme]